MPFVFFLVTFLVIVFAVRAGQRGGRNGLILRGLPARGLVLSADRTATEASVGGQRFEVRSIVLDVEIAGRDPYEVSLNAMIPRICEALPGATLDLRVDPRKPNNLAIIGPAGASQWLRAAVGVPGQTWAVLPVRSRAGFGTIVLVLIALSLAFGAVVSFVGGSERETPADPLPVRPAPAPAPRPTATVISPPTPSALHHHPECEAAARCCEVLGLASCLAYASETEAACTTALQQERKAALKVGKHCP